MDNEKETLEIKKRKPKWLKHLLFFLGACSIPFLAAYVVTEVHFAWYLHTTKTIRSDHSDNYGLAFEALILAVISIIVSLILIVFFWWRSTRSHCTD